MFQEGVCVLAGLGYNGTTEDGQHKWDACANMKMWLFETTPLFTGTISSFNINTNAWAARSVSHVNRWSDSVCLSEGYLSLSALCQLSLSELYLSLSLFQLNSTTYLWVSPRSFLLSLLPQPTCLAVCLSLFYSAVKSV